MADAQGSRELLWQDYVAVLVRRRWWFAIPCAVIVGVTMLVGLCLPKIYRAEAIVLVESPQIMNPLMSGVAVSTDMQQRMRVLVDQLLSWTSLGRLVKKLGLDRGIRTRGEFEGLISKLQRDIKVTFGGQGSLIRIQYDGANPHVTQDVVNTVTQVYLERNLEAETAEAETAIKFIESELTVYRHKLEESEQALREFKELHTMEMPVATQLNNQIINLEVQLAQLQVENTEEHPRVIESKRQIDELKRVRNEEIRRVIATAVTKGKNPELYRDLAQRLEAAAAPAAKQAALAEDETVRSARQAYEMWVERLDSAAVKVVGQPAPTAQATQPVPAAGAQAPVVAADAGAVALSLGPREEQELSRLQRGYDIHMRTYQEMQQRLELARITQRLGKSDEGTKFNIIEPARLPLGPVFPNLWLFCFGSLAVGLIVGTTAAFGIEYLDSAFQSPEDVQAALSMPIIGSISTIITTEDLAARRRRRKGWVSVGNHLHSLRIYILEPLWGRIDKTLVRWGL